MSSRRLFQALHRWVGLAIAAFLIGAGLTGSIIAFDEELDAWLNQDVWYVAPDGKRLPLHELIARVERRDPGSRVFFVPLEPRANLSQRMRLESRRSGESLPTEVWIDPYTGEVLAQRSYGSFHLDRRHLIPFLYRFHYSLALNEAGMLLTGSAALLWLLTTSAGIVLAWPRRGRWRQALSIRMSAGAVPAAYDAHRAGGMLLCAVFLLIAFSGFCMNVTQVSLPLVNLFSTVRGWPVDAMPERAVSESRLDADAALVLARAEVPDAIPSGLVWNYDKRVLTVELVRDEEPRPDRQVLLYFDMLDGRLLAVFDLRETTAGESFLLWQLPLHGGEFFGLLGRAMIALVGLALTALIGAGVFLWYRKWRVSSA